MRILIDVNLTPLWVAYLADHGHDPVHWTEVGDPRAPDTAILEWARQANQVVFTHDLDFGTLLAHTRDSGPSVVQLRIQDTLPDVVGAAVVSALEQHRDALAAGALVTVDPRASRVRILPIR